jgi:hypothetical protein
MDQLRQSFAASGFNIQQLLVDITTVTALHDVRDKRLITSAR